MQAEQSWTGRYVLDFGRLLADATEGLFRFFSDEGILNNYDIQS